MGHISLTNFEETFESSFKATFGELIFILLLIINNLFNLHHMSEGKTEKCEAWGSTQLCLAFRVFIHEKQYPVSNEKQSVTFKIAHAC